MLEIDNEIQIIIIYEKLPGQISNKELIKKIKIINEKIKIIFILEKENIEFEKYLLKNNINEIYYNNKINLNELIKIINKKEINYEEIIKIIQKKDELIFSENDKFNSKILGKNYKIIFSKIKEIFFIINNYIRKNYLNKKRKNMKLNEKGKIVNFIGNNKSGKTTLALALAQKLSTENKKIMLIDYNLEKEDLNVILKKHNKNIMKKIINKKNIKLVKKDKYKKRKLKLNRKKIRLKNNKKSIVLFYYNKIIEVSIIKINKNFYYLGYLKILFKYNKKLERFFINKYLNNKKNFFDYILIDSGNKHEEKKHKKILDFSDKNIIVFEADLLGIKELYEFINLYIKCKFIKNNKLLFISNRKKNNSINKKIINKIINKILNSKNKIIEIKENKNYIKLISSFYKNKYLLNNKKLKKELYKIIINI